MPQIFVVCRLPTRPPQSLPKAQEQPCALISQIASNDPSRPSLLLRMVLQGQLVGSTEITQQFKARREQAVIEVFRVLYRRDEFRAADEVNDGVEELDDGREAHEGQRQPLTWEGIVVNDRGAESDDALEAVRAPSLAFDIQHLGQILGDILSRSSEDQRQYDDTTFGKPAVECSSID